MKKQSCLIMVTLPIAVHAELKRLTEAEFDLSMSRLARELLTSWVAGRKKVEDAGDCCFSYGGVNYCETGKHASLPAGSRPKNAAPRIPS